MNITRECKKCFQTLPLTSFAKNSKSQYGRLHTCHNCSAEYQRGVRERKPFYNQSLKFGLTENQIQSMYEATEVCELCGKTNQRRLNIDHNHVTGKVRGLLCDPCNKGLGHFKDDPELIQKAIEYLKERG